MDLSRLASLFQDDPGWLVFVNVLLQQIGLPIPAVPTIMLAGSATPSVSAALGLVALAALASVIADAVWYAAGRVFGYRVLSGLCRLSLNPSSCVTQTESRFLRWGAWSLIVAKFIPGFAIVAPPIAGAVRMPVTAFLLAAAAGAALWAGLAIGAGWLLRDNLQAALALLADHGGLAAAAVGAVLLAWGGWKLVQRRRFERLADLPHITPQALAIALQSERPPLVIDLRSEALQQETARIVGARTAGQDDLLAVVRDVPADRAIVTVCACPSDAGAVMAARVLLGAGYRNVMPLRGGYDALDPSLRVAARATADARPDASTPALQASTAD